MTNETSNYQREIVELHQFFVDWYIGELAKTDAAFARFADVMADNFAIVHPGGVIIERDSLFENIYNTHNQRPGFRIWIENVELRHHDGNILVVSYEEWQAVNDDEPTTRLSTVIFRENDDAPNGLQWLHVHETWTSRLTTSP